MNFPCSKCGACCRRAGTIPDFPEPVTDTGACVHLLPDHSCAIYDTRPTICRVDKVYQELFSSMPQEEFYRLNVDACNDMQEEDGMGEEWRVAFVL